MNHLSTCPPLQSLGFVCNCDLHRWNEKVKTPRTKSNRTEFMHTHSSIGLSAAARESDSNSETLPTAFRLRFLFFRLFSLAIIDTAAEELLELEMMHVSGGASMRRRSFKDSIKLLEADIQHANTLSVVYFIFI